MYPAYLALVGSGELHKRVLLAQELQAHCTACGWACKVDRRTVAKGVCRTGFQARVSSYGPHPGEEPPISGWKGSGTVFFSSCNMHCQYCQNADISQSLAGDEIDDETLADIFLALQGMGCHNLNLVSPTHVLLPILSALAVAAERGLQLPLVYNTGGYDSVEALKLLDGVVDIYMPDMKYASAQTARFYSKAPNYPQVNQAAVREMHCQVGDLVVDSRGLAVRGVLVRHLVLPHNLAGTEQVVRFLADEISKDTYLNVMDQYHPAYKALQFTRLNRRITPLEFTTALQSAREAGLRRLAV